MSPPSPIGVLSIGRRDCEDLSTSDYDFEYQGPEMREQGLCR